MADKKLHDHPPGESCDDEDEGPAPMNLADLRKEAAACSDNAELQGDLARRLFRSLCRGQVAKDPESRAERLGELQALSVAQPADLAVRTCLAMGLFNVFVDAHAEGTFDQRDACLSGMRELHAAHPDDEPTGRHLAAALLNSTTYAHEAEEFDRRDAILDELRPLAAIFTEDQEIRWCVGQALLNAAVDAEEKGDTPTRDALMTEIRKLTG